MRLTSYIFHPSHPRGGHPPHSNLVREKLTSPTPTLQETGSTVLRPIREDELRVTLLLLNKKIASYITPLF